MASFNLKIKVIDREKLYFNRYSLRGTFKTEHLSAAYGVKDIDGFNHALSKGRHRYVWRGKAIDLATVDFNLIEKIIEFKVAAKKDKVLTIRFEGDKMSVYTNDMDVLEQMTKIQSTVELTQIVLSPAGTKYFKFDPPAKYRVYLKARRIDESTRNSLLDFFKRDLGTPCSALKGNVEAKNAWRWSWITNHNFIDYNEETTLTYMSLMFPGILGKTYKLEKKQG